jgi:DNA-binding transcriptional LysR family regulator
MNLRSTEILPKLLQIYRQHYPNVVVRLTEMSTEVQIQALLNGAVDIGFVHAPISHPDLFTATLFTESLIVALPPAHPLAQHEQ